LYVPSRSDDGADWSLDVLYVITPEAVVAAE
jgi:hypothetical protein